MNKSIKIISNFHRRRKRSGRKSLFFLPTYILGPLVFLVLCWFIGWQIVHQSDWRHSLSQVGRAITGPLQWKLWLVIALMPVNWGIEARKWQLALTPIGGIRFKDALRAIFTGTTMASFTPNRMGEYLGRILYIKEGKRLKAISLTIVCSIAQLIVTLVLGIGGLLYIHYGLSPAQIRTSFPLSAGIDFLLASVSLLFVGLTLVYFRLSWVVRVLIRIPWAKKYAGYLKVLENFGPAILLRILFLSFGRYLVFIVQYSLVFPVFGVSLGFGQVWGGMSVVFLVMAVVPTFTFLTELGLRWGASIQVLELFSPNMVGIFAASFAIWLINLIIPALIGSLLILSIKLFKSR